MRSIRVCVDRSRINLPPEDERTACRGYLKALEAIDTLAADSVCTVLVSKETWDSCADFGALKRRATIWVHESGTHEPVDQILRVLRGIRDKSARLEVYARAEMLVDDGAEGMPEDFYSLSQDESEDVRRVLALASLNLAEKKIGAQGSPVHLLTRLLNDSTCRTSVSVHGNVFPSDGTDPFPVADSVTCICAGHPQDLLVTLDDVETWMSADGDQEQLALAVQIAVAKVAVKNHLPRSRKWTFGCEFLSIASCYGYLQDKRKATFLLAAMAGTILGTGAGNPRPLCESANSKQLHRIRRHADRSIDKGMHQDIIASDLRLNYWDCGNGCIEFGAAMDHSNDQLLPECLGHECVS